MCFRSTFVDKKEFERRIAEWFHGPTKDFEKIWDILREAGEHKLQMTFDQGGERRAIILVQGQANVRRACALMEDV